VAVARTLGLVLSLVAGLSAVSLSLAAGPERAVVPVSINEVDEGTWLLLLLNGDVLARVQDLEKARLRGLGGQRETLDGEEFVHLGSLAPDVRFLLDTETLTLKMTVPPSYFGSTTLNFATGRPPGITYSTDTSAFFNYALNGSNFRTIEGFGEAGLSLRGNLLYSSVSRTAEGDVIRGMTNFTMDDRDHLRRWVVGDTFAAAGGLGGGLFLGGLSVSRNFGLDPYFVRYPTLTFSGALTTPSTVEVYVNGAMVRREQLPPGQFNLSDISVPTGTGAAEIVIRDAFGQQQSLTHPFYASSVVLARGLQEYTYNLGARRNDIGTSSADYQDLSFLGRHRKGLTDALTAEFRLEGDRDRVSGGPGLAVRLPAGEIEAELALSGDHGDMGSAGSAVYRYMGRPVNFGVFLQSLSPRYSNLSLTVAQDRPRLEASAFVGAQFGRRFGLTLQHTSSEMRDGPTHRLSSLLGSVTVARNASFVVSGATSRTGGQTDNQVFVGFSYSLKANTTASASYQRQAGTGTGTLELQKSLPVGTGYGYRLSGSHGDEMSMTNGLIQYQSPYGRYEASYSRVGDEAAENFSVSGGVVAIGGAIVPTRPVGESFALIRVPGAKDVAGFASNQKVGETSGKGNLLVPNLLPYYGNRLSIADSDLPLDYDIGATEKVVAPPYRGGAIVTFPVRRIQSVSGTVVLDLNGEDVVPSFGELTVTAGGNRFESPLGEQSEFYLENLPAGRMEATIEFRGITCSFALDIPDSHQPFLRLPPARCVASGVKESEP
jgi:outer membrane usher protein